MRFMKSFITGIMAATTLLSVGPLQALTDDQSYITIDEDALSNAKSLKADILIESERGVSLLKMDDKALSELSHQMHEEHHRCGGYVLHESKEKALEYLKQRKDGGFFSSIELIKDSPRIEETITLASEAEILQVIDHLSQYHNRFHQADSGQESQQWIFDKWKSLTDHRNDVELRLVGHRQTPQKSVELILKGSEFPQKYVIIGGHGDSISGYFSRQRQRAPGADDNASGIATITEVLRVLMASDFKPKYSIVFYSYAAEEVGLVGSKQIAQSYAQEKKEVLSVMQLDMTNYKGSSQHDIVFMTDYTNPGLTKALQAMTDEYVKVPWSTSRCGYGCSDHASWHNAGYPASMPFEAHMNESNSKIHTRNDTLETLGNQALQALNFAKLALVYMLHHE